MAHGKTANFATMDPHLIDNYFFTPEHRAQASLSA